MYKLHCSKCDNVIEPNDNFYQISYIEFGVGNYAAAPRYSQVCPGCFNEFKRSVDWEIGRCPEAEAVKPPVIGAVNISQ